MTALIIIGCILLFFVFLLSLKATITIAYTDEVTLSVRVLFLKIKILPKKEKKGPRSMSKKKSERIRAKARKKAQKKREAAKAKAEAKKQKKQAAKEKPKKSMSEILDTVSMVRGIAAEVIAAFSSTYASTWHVSRSRSPRGTRQRLPLPTARRVLR
ncbi:MAG: hypothetical protein IJD64_01400 [Clostridia bacterium]|nr:hypothetical protein [Clostridia bacterium]